MRDKTHQREIKLENAKNLIWFGASPVFTDQIKSSLFDTNTNLRSNKSVKFTKENFLKKMSTNSQRFQKELSKFQKLLTLRVFQMLFYSLGL